MPINCSYFQLASIFGLGTGELILVLILVLLLFGGANLPKLAESLGKSIKSFKKAVSSDEEKEKKEEKKQEE